MGNLFKSSKQTLSSQVNLPAWADKGLETTANRALGLMERPYQPFDGNRVAGLSDWTGSAAGTLQNATNYQPGQVTATNVTAGRVNAGSLAGRDLSAYYDPYQQQVIDAAMADVDRSTRVAQAGRAAGGVQAAGFGGFGDRSAVAAAEIERAGIDAKARTAAGLRSQGFQRAQDLATQDINREFQGETFNAQTGLQAGLANQQAGMVAQQSNVQAGLEGSRQRAIAAQQLAGLGEAERVVRQAELDTGYQTFREGRDDPFLKTQWAAGVIGGNASPYGGNVTQTTPGPSPFSQAMGAATSAAALYAISDPQEKTDKRRIGVDPTTGLGIWSYRYKGDPKRYPKVVGPMADEVEEVYPHLVRRVGGRRVVDMAGLAEISGGLGDVPGFRNGGLSDEPVGSALLPWLRRQFEVGSPRVTIGLGEDGGAEGWGEWQPAEAFQGEMPEVAPEPMRIPPGRRWGQITNQPVGATWSASRRTPLPPLIEGVAEPIPVTDAYNPTPPVPVMGAGAAVGEGIGPAPAVPRGGAAVGEGIGSEMAPPGVRDLAGEGVADGETLPVTPQVRAALARLRPQRRPAGGPGFAGESSAAPAPVVPGAGAAAAAAAAGSSREALPVMATPGAERQAAPAADDRSWLRRFTDRLVDPEYAGQVALLQAGLGMMASRNPNWAGAIGEGAMAGLQAVERARPMVRSRQQQREFQDWLRNLPDPQAVSAPIAPRRAGAPGAGEAPVRMTSVPVPPAGPLADRVALAESGGRDEARNPAPGSTAAGRLQITDALWSDYAPRLGLADDQRTSAEAQRAVFAAFEQDMRRDLPAVLGREPTDQDIYAAWGLGPAGFRALAANPDADAFDAYRGAAGETRARQAFSQNGALMRPGMRAGEVLDAWRGRLPGGARPAAAAPAGGEEGRGAVVPASARPDAMPAEVEPTIQVGGRALTRAQILAMSAAMPDNENVQRFVQTALPILNGEIARRDAAADRALARQEQADLRRELAGRGREPQPTELSRLLQERDALPPGDPRRASYDAAIRRASGEAAAERFTPAQVVQLRRDAFAGARQEANGLDFDTEADRSGWINQRARELVQEWGVPEVLDPGAGGGPAVRLGASGRPEAPDATADTGARIRPRGPTRVLPDSARRELGRLGEAGTVMSSLVADFRPDYGGFVSEFVGDTANFIARRTPGESPRADWWARYQEQVNLIRNSLFGSALTRTEKEQFDKASINPGMTPEAIRSRLQEQAAAAQRAAMRLARSYAEGGYNRREVEAALGMPIPTEAPAPGAGAVSGQGGGQQRQTTPPPPPRQQPNSLERFMPGGQ
jgi:hypothetical protein